MSNEANDGLDRRVFMIATIASVAASTGLAVSNSGASAQGTTAPAASSAKAALKERSTQAT